MRYKLTFVAGFAVGYTLGARAGHARYEQISRTVRGLSESPTVQSAAGVLQAQVGKVTEAARDAVFDRLGGRHGSDPYGSGPVPAGHNGHHTQRPPG